MKISNYGTHIFIFAPCIL